MRADRYLVVLFATVLGCADDGTGAGDDGAVAADAIFGDEGARDSAVTDDAAVSDTRVFADSSSPSDTDAPVDTKASADVASDSRDGGGVSYATDFDLTESPISEGGAWTHLGLDWRTVQTGGGIAFGTQTGTGGYDDSYAHLSGFPADQTASGVIHRAAVIDGSCTHEVEILLRWSDAAHDAHGYECNLAYDGAYAEIVRWEGAFGKYTYLARGSVPGGVKEGDVLGASAIGDVITLSVNGKKIIEATDSTWKTGNPGMAFWRGGPCGKLEDYGFTRYTASSVP